MNSPDNSPNGYDVVILGGALSGAATATLLLRENPGLRVLIVEKSSQFTRRVGEATVEVSGYFLGRLLGLTRHLNESHLIKQGMRFWFSNEATRTLEDCSEIGSMYLVRLPAYQVDRAVLDEEVLARAVALGAELWRPARVTGVSLASGGLQRIEVSAAGETRRVHCRWVVDASGFAAILARQNDWLIPNTDHPTSSAWARWRGVKDWDGLELATKHPVWAAACRGIRSTATNHFMGDGWWAWCIPLKGGDVSIGVVFDQRMVDWPEDGPVGERLRQFLARHPVARELMDGAECVDGDVHWRKNLPYSSSVYAGDGFALVGDAAAFIDPLYSPGLDWMAFTACSTARLIQDERSGMPVADQLARHNASFRRSYERWFNAVYRDKYAYLGEYDLMRMAFLLDLGFYYLGVVSQPFKRGARAFLEPVFSTKPSAAPYHIMRIYNRRFAQIAHSRRLRGRLGLNNRGKRFLFSGYSLEPGSVMPLIRTLMEWIGLELTEGWRSWFGAFPIQARCQTEEPSGACPIQAPGGGGS